MRISIVYVSQKVTINIIVNTFGIILSNNSNFPLLLMIYSPIGKYSS